MVKKMVYLEEQQNEIVKRLASEKKISDSEVIRQAISAYGAAVATQLAGDTRRVMQYLAAHSDWNDEPAEFFHG